MGLYDNATGAPICIEHTTYGGSAELDLHRYSEPGFIAVPPCIWGRSEHGLLPPPVLSGRSLRIVKRCNATYGHHGEMAHGQVYYTD